MDFNTGVVVGWCMARGKKGGGGGGSTSDIWKPPDHWLTIPEPADNQAIFYVEVPGAAPSISISFGDGRNGEYGNGTIDWGDGYVDRIPENYAYACIHPYSAAGSYIITATCNGAPWININNKYYNFIMNTPVNSQDYKSGLQRSLKAVKLGKNVKFVTIPDSANDMYGMTLIYMKFAGEIQTFRFQNYRALEKIEASVISNAFSEGGFEFSYCYSLHDIDFLKDYAGDIPANAFDDCRSLTSVNLPNVTSIGNNAFISCYSLKSINLPNVTSLGDTVFSACYSLKELIMPKVSSVGANEFNSCYNLRSLTVADGCNFNGNQFTYCPALYPKPQ